MKWTKSMKICKKKLLTNFHYIDIRGRNIKDQHPGIYDIVYFKLKEQGKI